MKKEDFFMKFAGLEKVQFGVVKIIKSVKGWLEKLPTPVKMLLYIGINLFIYIGIRFSILRFDELFKIVGLVDFNEFDLLLAQISNTFIVLSLTSALSTSMGTIYWVDIKEEKLVRPFGTCFYALTGYLLSSMGISIFDYILSDSYGLCVSFFMSVLCLIILTYSMIDAYFNREKLELKYKWKYIKLNSLFYKSTEYGNRVQIINFNIKSLRYILSFDKRYTHVQKYAREFSCLCKFREELDKVADLDSWDKVAQNFLFIKKTEGDREIEGNMSAKLYNNTIVAINAVELDAVYENILLMLFAKNEIYLDKVLQYTISFNISLTVDILSLLWDKLFEIVAVSNTIQNTEYCFEVSELNWVQKLIKEYALKGITCIDITYQQLLKLLQFIGPNEKEYANYVLITGILFNYKFKIKNSKTDDEKSKDEQNSIVRKKIKQFNGNTISDSYYKPIKELYYTYLKQEISLMEYYVNFLLECKMVIQSNLLNKMFQIKDIYHFRFISEVDEEYLNLIFRREEIDPILPPKMIQDLKNLIYIEL